MTDRAIDMKKYQKLKELHLYNVLQTNYKMPTEYGVRVSRECGGRNSEEKEFGYNWETHKVFVECDENQHKSYCTQGEINRMKNIYMNEGGPKIIFIRYNPDTYRENDKLTKIPQSEKELQLVKWLQHYEQIENVKHHLSVHYLFYDNHTETGTTCEKIDPY
jgi:hypothetical protein